MKKALWFVALALALGLWPMSAQADTKAPGPATKTCYSRIARVNIPQLFVAGSYAEWEIHYRWCSTGILWGNVTGYSQYHTLSGLGSLSLSHDDGIIEDSGTYYTWRGHWHGGHYAHVKGRITSCFFGVCGSVTPWANIWVHMDGSYHATVGGV